MLDKKDYADLDELDRQKAREIIFTDEKDMLLVAKVVSLSMFILGTAMVVINAIEGNKAMVIVSLVYGPLFLLSFKEIAIGVRPRISRGSISLV